jgi:hypothetical protein
MQLNADKLHQQLCACDVASILQQEVLAEQSQTVYTLYKLDHEAQA